MAQFTELAALTGKATKSTTEEMGSLFATGYGIYKGFYDDMSDLEFGEMFSAGIATAVKNYKTSGSEMASAISALGATATNANVPLEEQLAIMGQLQTTMSGSEAATKYKSFLNQALRTNLVRRCPESQMRYQLECQQPKAMRAHSSPICRRHIRQAAEASKVLCQQP